MSTFLATTSPLALFYFDKQEKIYAGLAALYEYNDVERLVEHELNEMAERAGNPIITGNAAIKSVVQIDCSPLSLEEVSRLRGGIPKSITRHLDQEGYELSLSGSFRFGTIDRYRPPAGSLGGRLGDRSEGNRQESFKNVDGSSLDYQGSLINFAGNESSGFENDIIVEYRSNDFCSCSSIGPFDLQRFNAFRNAENAVINAYVTYDTEKLIDALHQKASEDGGLKEQKLIWQNVEYGEKNMHWINEKIATRDGYIDKIELWKKLTYTKSESYKHEDEFRMLLVNPDGIGQLALGSKPITFIDKSIADSIVAHGVIHS